MSHHDEQKLEELSVFNEFAQVCALPLLPKSARPGPDPPDVLCVLSSGETLGFELVSCEDVTNNGISWTKGASDEIKLRAALKTAYDEAVAAAQIDQPEKFTHCLLDVDFKNGATLHQRERAVSEVIEHLKLGPGCHMSTHNVIRSIKWQLNAHSSDVGPTFSVGSSYCAAGNSTLLRIKAKIEDSRPYTSQNATQLLAYSTSASFAESEFWNNDLLDLLQSLGMGRFERIWVFGTHEQSIVFDSAASSAG